MSDIDAIVSVSITADTRTPTQAGFGIPLLLGWDPGLTYGTVYTGTELSDVTTAGASATGSIYKMANALLSQDPRPEEFKFATISGAHTQSADITVTSAVEGAHVKLTIVQPNGSETAIDYTILAAATTTTVATALELLIEAVTGISSTSSGAVVTATAATPGNLFGFKNFTNCTYKSTTADANFDDALTAYEIADTEWYAVCIDANSETNIDLVAAWVEARTKLFIAQTQNDNELAGTGTIASDLEALGYDRTAVIWTKYAHEFANAAWLGSCLAQDPGSITWAFKELDGVTPASLTPTQINTLEGNQCNYYTTVAGLSITRKGTVASGEYIDVTHGVDWLTARLQERIFGILASAKKVPYTDASVDRFVGEILSQLEDAVTRGLLRADTLSASGPLVADVSLANRAARHLPDLKFGAELAGAVHKVTIAGTVSV